MDTRRFILRLIAGGYVFYLGIQLITEQIKGADGFNPIVGYGVGVLFLIFGAWSVLSALIPVFKNGGFVPTGTEGASDEDSEQVVEDEESAEEVEVMEDAEVIDEAAVEDVSADKE